MLSFSTAGNSLVSGAAGPYDDADVYLWDGTLFSKSLDGTAVGLPGNADIDAVASENGQFYFSFNRDGGTNIPGLGLVQDEDIVKYNPATGEWQRFFIGADACGLNSANSQDVDAILILGGSLYFSTFGNGLVAGAAAPYDDADIYHWDGSACSRVFDASAAGLPDNADIDGLSAYGTQGVCSFSANGGTILPGLGLVQDEDVVLLDPPTGTWTMFFDGSTHGFDASNAQDLDAIDIQ